MKVKDEHVEVIPLGIWKFWALRRKLRIPVDTFETVEIRSDAYDFPRGVRAPGTRIPNFMVAGTYRSGALGTLFLISRRNRQVVVADFETEKAQRFIIQVSKAEQVKAMLLEHTEAVDGGRSSSCPNGQDQSSALHVAEHRRRRRRLTRRLRGPSPQAR